MNKGLFFLLSFFAGIALFTIFYINLQWRFLGFVSDQATSINEIYKGLSFSFVAAYCFYILTVIIPYEVKKKKYNPFICDKFKIIYEQVDSCIITFKPININEKYIINNITYEELQKLISNKSFYDTSNYSRIKGANYINIQHLYEMRDYLYKLIPQFLEYKDYLSENIVSSIENIRNSEFFMKLNIHNSQVELERSIADGSILYQDKNGNNLPISKLLDEDGIKEPMIKDLWEIIINARKIKDELNLELIPFSKPIGTKIASDNTQPSK